MKFLSFCLRSLVLIFFMYFSFTAFDTSYFNTFDITYTSWYASIPTDIQLLMYIMISAELNRDWGKTVSSYKVWDVSVSYVDSEASPLIIDSIISKYKLINI